ncbi:serine/threonine/tyrosine-interacting-like protein 1 isoform X2 [Scleropages formosus]|nr:serine/threonine/tyrosine-interacting-like protein 1 isoform X2 [Scleropages formosus]
MMSQIILCDATELYNILNQYFRVSRLVEFNYLCLIDARSQEEYNESHIITARKAKWDDEGKFVMPAGVEIESMRYCVVYDSNTSSLQGSGPATDCTGILAKSSRYPVQILKGGYERFSALYPFFRTQKILYTLKELESMKPYPVEILPGQLYMGDYRQATSPQIHKDLKLQAVVNVSEKTNHVLEASNCDIYHIPVADSVEGDLLGCFERVCTFIGSHFSAGSAILIFSSDGISRCSTVSIAFLQYHLKFTLQEAWEHMLKCKSNMRPKRGFVQQLSDWEVHTLGERKTFIAEPHY